MRTARSVNPWTFAPQVAVLDDQCQPIFTVNIERMLDLIAAGNSREAAFYEITSEFVTKHPAAVALLASELLSSKDLT